MRAYPSPGPRHAAAQSTSPTAREYRQLHRPVRLLSLLHTSETLLMMISARFLSYQVSGARASLIVTADEPVYVIGDIHGQLGKLIALLRGAGLATDRLSWAAGAATLWFMGDFFDRGPDGLGVLDLVMRLQREAAVAGGQVASLLGNHEVMLLAAQRFAGRPRFTRGYQLKRSEERR